MSTTDTIYKRNKGYAKPIVEIAMSTMVVLFPEIFYFSEAWIFEKNFKQIYLDLEVLLKPASYYHLPVLSIFSYIAFFTLDTEIHSSLISDFHHLGLSGDNRWTIPFYDCAWSKYHRHLKGPYLLWEFRSPSWHFGESLAMA